MAGLGEILEENTRLRESLAEREREVAALLAQLGQKNAVLEALRDRAEDLARRLEMSGSSRSARGTNASSPTARPPCRSCRT